MIAVFAGLLAAGLVSAFLQEVALYLLAATGLVFLWLCWRARGSHTDLTMRIGVGSLMLALAFIVMRPHLNLG